MESAQMMPIFQETDSKPTTHHQTPSRRQIIPDVNLIIS
jgi:hypothetical protein